MIEDASTRRQALQDYDVQGRSLRRPDLRAGLPGIRAATRRGDGLPVLVKTWPRREGLDDRELEEIWRHEVRQLQRLVSYPGAQERLAILRDSTELDDGFHLMLGNDHRLPLQHTLDDPRAGGWFRTPRTPRHRVRLWEEMVRIVEGLDILHSQGLLHRNIDTWSVLTAVGEQPDFILTGFEWSIRLTSATVGRQRRRSASPQRSTRYSFYEDWRAIGVLACRLLNFPARRGVDPYFPDVDRDADFLLAAERDLLVLLLAADPLSRLDAGVVLDRIAVIVEGLRAQLMGGQPRLVLAVGLGPASAMSRAIFEASGGVIEPDEEAEQLLFVRQDLGDEPRLARLRSRDQAAPPQYVLRGAHLTYRLRQFVPNHGPATWAIARSMEAESLEPAHARIEESRLLGAMPLEIMPLREAAATAGRLFGATTRWDQVLNAVSAPPSETALQDRTYGALTLFQVVEMLIDVADIWPVTVVRERGSGASVLLEVRVRRDEVLESLSDALDLQPPAIRLERMLESEQMGVEGEWRLTEEAVLGVRGGERARWRLIEVSTGKRPTIYTFEGSGPAPNGTDLYLRAGGDGHDRLLQRKLKALRSLREHGELLEMLASPRLQRRPSHDRWNLDGLGTALDQSKMDALRQLWSVLPLYLLQGPPGVGKTKLVQELVAARMGQDGAERLLLTAQSHAAVDHLLEKVRSELEVRRDPERPDPVLALRCRPRGHPSGSSPWDVPMRTAAIARDLAASELAEAAPTAIRRRVDELVASYAEPDEVGATERTQTRMGLDRSFQSLLLRSANLVFSSTNARELETLIEERAQFDWSVVEEAGKATGVDLLAPMLLSHRRLMIGDHRQLPPFNSERMEKLFAAPARIAEALEVARHLLARPFGQAGIEDALDFVAGADVETLASSARSMMLLFESMIEAETKAPRREGRLPMALQLEQQHRMHPAIGKLVADSFYPGALFTSEEAVRRFANDRPPSRFSGSVLEDCPVTFVDMPFAHEVVGGTSPEMSPRWINRPEAQACVRVLERLRATEGCRPELAVLSPYRAQRRVLDDAIAGARRAGSLANLEAFAPVGGELCHTVDSFQGNEADVVLISLVRNNAHSGVKSLGFLSDRRRMNVLMSRGRWRLVLVGSLRFLRARFQDELPAVEGDKLGFLRDWLASFDELTRTLDGDGRPLARVVPIASLIGDRA